MGEAMDASGARSPLARPSWAATYGRMRERDDAPLWNGECGDRLRAQDLEAVLAFESGLGAAPSAGGEGPSGAILERITRIAGDSPWTRRALSGLSLPRDWALVGIMTREDLRDRLAEIVPLSADLSRLIVNPTSGTGGVPVRVPSHPFAQACYDPLIARALAMHGVGRGAGWAPGQVAAVQLCYQRRTLVYCAAHAYRNGAGFAKVNLDPSGWKEEAHRESWLAAMEPSFLSGDPVAYEAWLAMGGRPAPGLGALLSTAMRLSPPLRARLETLCGAPVVDFYSTNETGPLACSDPAEPSRFVLLCPDIHVEIADARGCPLPEGEEGEILVTGGRNPYLPLLRYRTGDRGRITRAADGGPRLELSVTREALLLPLPGGGLLNPVDIARALLPFPVRRHAIAALDGGRFELRLDCPGLALVRDDVRLAVEGLLGPGASLSIAEGFEDLPYKTPPARIGGRGLDGAAGSPIV